MWGNTQPTLFEVKLWEDITTNALSSLVISRSSLYGAPHKLRTHTPLWFPDPRCRTSGREPTPFGPTTWHYDGDRWRRRQTKTEADEDEADGDGRRQRRRQSKTNTESLWRRANWQLPYSWRPPPEWKQNLILLLSCNPLTPEPMKVAAAGYHSFKQTSKQSTNIFWFWYKCTTVY